ncbi:ABC transporter permease [Deferribacterales bacterium Es71-Z0220]|uniref:ABC transporter permease n=1 Tax=Deferrivibrio essentukiensis TaxID=2880922 RepID=UPI001F61AD4E|nr:ABC transporter permease [Deferrivibrio essentukiensis]MCB4204406.1 ABC transporter permease [Deferrivibrio essentukiensis]
MKNSEIYKLIFYFLSGFLILFFSYPIAKLIYNVGLSNILNTISEKEVYKSIGLTFYISFYAVIIAFIAGIPLAYILARYNFWGKSFVEAVIDLPTMIPHTAAGIAILLAYNNTFINNYFNIRIIDSKIGIMFAMMFLSSSYLVNGAKEGFRKVDIKLENAARTLGANWFSAFTRVVVPNARHEIINGMLMMWARGIGEFGAIVIIAYHPMVAPVLIYDRFNNFGLQYSAPVAAAMILMSMIVFISVRIINKKT